MTISYIATSTLTGAVITRGDLIPTLMKNQSPDKLITILSSDFIKTARHRAIGPAMLGVEITTIDSDAQLKADIHTRTAEMPIIEALDNAGL